MVRVVFDLCGEPSGFVGSGGWEVRVGGGGGGRQGFSRSIVRVGRLMASWVVREHQRWGWER
jgi:hypothetical protein